MMNFNGLLIGKVIILICIASWLGSPLAPAYANAFVATITVTTLADELTANSQCSLREAIQSANTDSAVGGCPAGSGDDRILLPNGILLLTLAGANEDNNGTGDLDIRSNLTLSGLGTAATVINGNQLDRVLQIHPGVTVTAEHLTITNGKSPAGAASSSGRGEDGAPGGGILNGGNLTLRSVVVRNNRTGDGGASGFGSVTAANGGPGGGIFTSGVLTMIFVQVSDNGTGQGSNGGTEASAGDGGDGGGIANAGTLTIIDSWVDGNHTGGSGGVFTRRAMKGGNGGGLFNVGTALVTASTISKNYTDAGSTAAFPPGAIGASAGLGGGLYNTGVFTATNSTISGNRTANGTSHVCPKCGAGIGGDGGGIYNLGTVALQHATVVDNVTGDGGASFSGKARGGDGGGIFSEGKTNLQSTILAANVAARNGADCSATLTSLGFNLVQDVTACVFHGNEVGNVLNQAPRLLPLADNGGATNTHALLHGSPAIDAGSCADAISGGAVTTDQRGIVRPQMRSCDIGAYEALPFLFLPIIRR